MIDQLAYRVFRYNRSADEMMKNKFIKADKQGRLYIPNKDFFNQEDIIKQISTLKKSNTYRQIRETITKQQDR